ncbi:hypothetical protein GCM10011498_00150 [Amylibacter cionae]|uniref:Tc1-like transposase DDE domain-containing protein n=1 Tax=Neptunicoccus cionae TaxID=2035344 RepID=A0A916VM01_9RHOB|nr:hypothetical protein GCM10011498_00150 [Amylibacter cionae]
MTDETDNWNTQKPGDVVIADNLSSHKSAYAQNVLKAQGNWILFLPPYSPDLNPIAMAYSKLKAHLRRLKARPPTHYSSLSRKPVTSSHQKNAGNSSKLPEMLQIKWMIH